MRDSGLPQTRSTEMVFAGYFLSRLTRPDGLPPASLGVDRWNEAYDRFYDSCADGRSHTVFRNSLKNARDSFDSHLSNPRRGWYSPAGSPRPLGTLSNHVLETWNGRSDSELEEAISELLRIVPEWVPSQPASGGVEAGEVLGGPPVDPIFTASAEVPMASPRRARDAKSIGDLAEKHVMAHLTRTLSPDELETLIHHAAIGETPGYDISYRTGDALVAIEVKGTTSETMASFFISANEWRTAEVLGDSYHLYLVGNVESDRPVLEILNHPFEMVGQELQLTPMVWSVSRRR